MVTRYVPEHSVVIMGEHFQSQMVHASLLHNEIMNLPRVSSGPTNALIKGMPQNANLCQEENMRYLACDKQGSGAIRQSTRKCLRTGSSATT